MIRHSLALLGLMIWSCLALASGSELRKAATWQWPPVIKFEKDFRAYLDRQDLRDEQRLAAEKAWESVQSLPNGPQKFDALLEAIRILDDRFDRLLTQLIRPSVSQPASAHDLRWMDDSIPPWIQSCLRLAVARSLAQLQLYDEALQLLKLCDLEHAIDPSTVLFYRAVCHHHLLHKDECLAALNQLQEREAEIATRYAITSRLMKADIEPLKEDTLDEVSRLMNDVQRRLDLGRSGKVVRDQEKRIVDKLDKMIEQMEQQLQEQQRQRRQRLESGQDRKNQGHGKPMEDSQIVENSGQGDVDPKKIGDKSGWGNLPPAQRQEVLQNITKDLPSHYREVIEAYFKALATDTR